MKPTHTLTDADFEQLLDTAILAQIHDITEENDKILLTDLEDPTTTVTTTRADVQRAYDSLLAGHPEYPNLSARFQNALKLSDEGGFDDGGQADCLEYDALLQIAAYGDITIA